MSYVKLIAGLDHTNALEAATAYSNDGADEIAYMDMSAIEEGREPDVEFMKKIAETAEVPLIVGGGVKRLEDVKKMLYAGAAKVYMKHAARLDIHFVKEMSERFGKDKIGVAIDMNDVDVVSFAVKCEEMGAGSIWLLGFNTGMEQRVREIKEALDVPVMIDVDNASEEQLAKTILDSTVDAVLYTGTTIVNMMQIKHFLSGKNIEVNTFESALDFDTF